MKLPLLLSLALPFAALGDDMFVADGKLPVARNLTYQGKVLEHVQIGERQADGRITVHHKTGVVYCTEKELPDLWVKALTRREASRLVPDMEKKPGTASTIEKKEAAQAYERAVSEALATAVTRVVTPVPLLSAKADGTYFSGSLLGLKPGFILITDGSRVAWVTDAYFADPGAVRSRATVDVSLEKHAAARKEAEAVAREKGRAKWPDDFDMQQYEYEKQMTAWDQQYPAPKPAKTPTEPAPVDPFANPGKPKRSR